MTNPLALRRISAKLIEMAEDGELAAIPCRPVARYTCLRFRVQRRLQFLNTLRS
jgi:hypothetical protein